jgi:thymidylate kinase
LIIADRYFYDWFIQGYHSKTPRWLFPVLKLVLPRPDLVVYLENSPEIIHSRKPELTLEQLEYQGCRSRKIISDLPYSLTLSTDSTVNEVVTKISHRITNIMVARVR